MRRQSAGYLGARDGRTISTFSGDNIQSCLPFSWHYGYRHTIHVCIYILCFEENAFFLQIGSSLSCDYHCYNFLREVPDTPFRTALRWRLADLSLHTLSWGTQTFLWPCWKYTFCRALDLLQTLSLVLRLVLDEGYLWWLWNSCEGIGIRKLFLWEKQRSKFIVLTLGATVWRKTGISCILIVEDMSYSFARFVSRHNSL